MTYTSKELCAQASITHRQMDSWYRNGWLAPYGRSERDSSGTPLDWSISTVAKAVLMGRLVRVGFRPAKAHELAQGLLDNPKAAVNTIQTLLLEDRIQLLIGV